MPRSRSGRQKSDFPAHTGKLVVDTFRGQMRVRAWPRKRGPARTIPQKNAQDWFAWAARESKAVPPFMTVNAMDVTKGTGLYPRDIIMRAMGQGLLDIELADGRILRHRSPQMERIVFSGARLEFTSDPSFTANIVKLYAWPLPVLDTGDFWNLGQPTRLTVPAHIQIVQLTAGFVSNVGSNGLFIGFIRLNGVTTYAAERTQFSGRPNGTISTGPIPVQEGDYFEFLSSADFNGGLIAREDTFFSIQVLNANP